MRLVAMASRVRESAHLIAPSQTMLVIPSGCEGSLRWSNPPKPRKRGSKKRSLVVFATQDHIARSSLPIIDSITSASLLALTAAQVYESMTNGGASDFSALVRILNANRPWCLIGALAVNYYIKPIAETYPKLREKIPLEIVEQLK